ncbi:hypothetical protein [Sorangium sp. So ce1335]|uniref:hypothetical protein n=1 Tax=Sorangium sp. So ce1335 TaxID=3133335 RepID=UPI003F5D7F40
MDLSTMSLEGGDISITARTRRQFGGPLMLDVLAHIFVSRLTDEGFSVSAVAFTFSGGKRLVMPDGGALLSLQLDPSEGTDAEWRSLGWYPDEYGEWSGLTQLDGSE